jgi:protein-disulfide isomerase
MSEQKNSKKDFWFGLVTGVAIVAIIGFFIMLIMYFNKDDKKDIYSNDLDSYEEEFEDELVVEEEVDIKITDADQIKGDDNAPVTIVEYSDYQCPYCANFNSTMNKVADNYGDKVRWVHRHFPLDAIHKYARKAAEASECAGDQGKFWEYSDKLFENQSKINDSLFSKLAKDLNLNVDEFDKCVESGKFEDKVDNDYKGGSKIGVSGTPAIFINNEPVKGGALPYDKLKTLIDELL